ncbi:glutathione S-transferase theta-1 [Corvus moneduloides]|nr:glutathione S-transferase theta-1 [Corvus moneduloides]
MNHDTMAARAGQSRLTPWEGELCNPCPNSGRASPPLPRPRGALLGSSGTLQSAPRRRVAFRGFPTAQTPLPPAPAPQGRRCRPPPGAARGREGRREGRRALPPGAARPPPAHAGRLRALGGRAAGVPRRAGRVGMGLELYLDLLSQPCRSIYIFARSNNIPFEFKHVELFKDSVLGKKPAAGSGAEQPRAGPSNSEGAGKVSLLKKVPALKDGDFTLAECTAILLYLSRKYNTPDHWYPSDIQKRARVDEYLSWHHANIRANAPKTMWIKVLIPLFTGQPLPSEKLQEVMEGLSTSLKQFEERFLQDKAFIIGNEISLADLVAIVELMQPVGVGCDIFEDRPRLREWRRRVEDAVGKELFFQAHEMILNIKELSNIQIDPQLKEQLAPVLMKMLK